MNEPMNEPTTVKIRRDWLDACGYCHIAKQDYPVLSVMPRRLPDGSRMFVVDFHGNPWVVAE